LIEIAFIRRSVSGEGVSRVIAAMISHVRIKNVAFVVFSMFHFSLHLIMYDACCCVNSVVCAVRL